jgi:hypothetical protein
MTPPGTHRDWNPRNVDLLAFCKIAGLCGIPIEYLWRSIEFDPSFPPYRRDGMGRRVWRLPDLNEYFDGAR